MNGWNPERRYGRLPGRRGLFVFILGRVRVCAGPLEEPRVLRNDPALQEELKYEVRPHLKAVQQRCHWEWYRGRGGGGEIWWRTFSR